MGGHGQSERGDFFSVWSKATRDIELLPYSPILVLSLSSFCSFGFASLVERCPTPRWWRCPQTPAREPVPWTPRSHSLANCASLFLLFHFLLQLPIRLKTLLHCAAPSFLMIMSMMSSMPALALTKPSGTLSAGMSSSAPKALVRLPIMSAGLTALSSS